jgi:hypothetical protein
VKSNNPRREEEKCDPRSSGKMTKDTVQILGQQITFSPCKEPQRFLKSKCNKDVGEKLPPWDKQMGRKKMKSR